MEGSYHQQPVSFAYETGETAGLAQSIGVSFVNKLLITNFIPINHFMIKKHHACKPGGDSVSSKYLQYHVNSFT